MRREVGDFAVVLVGADFEQRAAPDAGVGGAVAAAALHASAVARVGDVALAAPGDVGRVAQVAEAQQSAVVAAQLALAKPWCCVLSTVRMNSLVSSVETSSSRLV